MEAVPMEAVPMEAVPMEAVPMEAVPMEAAPMEAVPMEAVPSGWSTSPNLNLPESYQYKPKALTFYSWLPILDISSGMNQLNYKMATMMAVDNYP